MRERRCLFVHKYAIALALSLPLSPRGRVSERDALLRASGGEQAAPPCVGIGAAGRIVPLAAPLQHADLQDAINCIPWWQQEAHHQLQAQWFESLPSWWEGQWRKELGLLGRTFLWGNAAMDGSAGERPAHAVKRAEGSAPKFQLS